MKRIFLIGYMGSGKTTLGRAYAHSCGLGFIDLDWYVEERMHKTISELFAERGETGFRETERNMLHEVGEFEDVVIACGGGTPCFFDNMDYMNSRGETLFLDTPVEVLVERLRRGRESRPLLAGIADGELREFVTRHRAFRLAFYLKAKHKTIET